MASSRKPRELANPDVSSECIVSALSKYRGLSRWQTLLGAEIVSVQHSVTPSYVCRLSPLINDFLEIGFKNLVLPMSKFEAAMLSTMDVDDVPSGRSAQVWASMLCEHIRLCCNMLRIVKLEDDTPTDTPMGRRRYPKSGGFRKVRERYMWQNRNFKTCIKRENMSFLFPIYF